MTRFLSRSIPALALLALAFPALGNPATLQINANVLKSCRVSNTTPSITLNYDVFDPATATASTTFGVRCTKNTTIQVTADGGTNGAAGPYARAVSNGTESLGYELALTPGSELVAGTPAAVGLSAGRNADVPVTFHATLDTGAATDPTAGSYTDTVVLTFTAL